MSSGQSLTPAHSGLSRSTTAKPVTRQLTPVKLARQRIVRELRTDDSNDREIADERKNANKAKDTYYKTRHWAQQHKLCLPQAPLPQPVLDVIEEWFFLVDDDGSGSLDADELEAAFTACDVPCDKASIQAMVTAITHDGRHGAEIFWEDFKAFMTGEFTAGKNMLKGDYVLPGGQQLPFGLIIKRLKRHMLLSRIMAGGEERDNVARQHKLAMLDFHAEANDGLPGSKRARVRDRRRRRMSLGAVVAMEMQKYSEGGIDMFDCAMKEFMEQTNLDEVLANDRQRTMLKCNRSRSITATRRASIARCSSLNSAASGASLSAGDSFGRHGTGAVTAVAPFPELQADVELQMPPLAVSPSGEIWVQACSPKQVMQDVAHAEGRRLRTQADSDQHWHHLLSPQPPTDPPSHGRGVNGGTSASCIAPGRGPEGAGGEGLPEDQGSAAGGRRRPSGWKAHAVKVAPRRELSPPRRTATPQPLPQALIDVASRHSGFAMTMRAAGAAPGDHGEWTAGAAAAARRTAAAAQGDDSSAAPSEAGAAAGRKAALLPPLHIPTVTWSCELPSTVRDAASPDLPASSGPSPPPALRTVHTLAPLPSTPTATTAAISSATLQKLLSSPTMKPAGNGPSTLESPRHVLAGASRTTRPTVLFHILSEDGDDEDVPRLPNGAAAGGPPPGGWAAAEAAGSAWSDTIRTRLKAIDPAPIEENLPRASAQQLRMHALEGFAQSAFVASVTGAGAPVVRLDLETENPWDAVPLDLTTPAMLLPVQHVC